MKQELCWLYSELYLFWVNSTVKFLARLMKIKAEKIAITDNRDADDMTTNPIDIK